jgi:hypothetical protein
MAQNIVHTPKGVAYLAVPAGFQDGGCDVYDVTTKTGTFVDSITVSPLDDVQVKLEEWVNAR